MMVRLFFSSSVSVCGTGASDCLAILIRWRARYSVPFTSPLPWEIGLWGQLTTGVGNSPAHLDAEVLPEEVGLLLDLGLSVSWRHRRIFSIGNTYHPLLRDLDTLLDRNLLP